MWARNLMLTTCVFGGLSAVSRRENKPILLAGYPPREQVQQGEDCPNISVHRGKVFDLGIPNVKSSPYIKFIGIGWRVP